jgi:hypothetical protein
VIVRKHLAKRWIHSHEEDTDDETVYRAANAGYQFPPARGRYSFILRRDGTYLARVPGADDRPEGRTGRWKLESGDKLVLESDESGRQVLEVANAADDVIKIKRRPTTSRPGLIEE